MNDIPRVTKAELDEAYQVLAKAMVAAARNKGPFSPTRRTQVRKPVEFAKSSPRPKQ